MRVPGALDRRSPRPYAGLAPLAYPLHDWTGAVTHCGRICYKSRKINPSQVFGAGCGSEAGGRPHLGSSPSWPTIWATSTTSPVGSSRRVGQRGLRAPPRSQPNPSGKLVARKPDNTGGGKHPQIARLKRIDQTGDRLVERHASRHKDREDHRVSSPSFDPPASKEERDPSGTAVSASPAL